MDLLYQLALTLVPNIGDVQARLLIHHLGDAASVFRERREVLEKIEGIGRVRALSIKSFSDFERAEAELRFIEQYKIKTFFITDRDYPQRLHQCYDAPVLMFYKGNADLNASRIVSIVGTRSLTEYGRQATEALVAGLARENITIVSGLAFGIDALAHKAALKNGLPTIGVVGHGLDLVYPYQHTSLAREIIRSGGGMLTEFFSGTQPDRHHFPLRNRIVAGISDATIVVETHVKGGSMITAKLADAYNRDVLALPGRITDRASSGCNHLIKYNKAILLTDAEQLLEVLGWKKRKKEAGNAQRELFVDLPEEELRIIELLQGEESVHVSEIHIRSGLSSSIAASAILHLELKNIIYGLPGNRYRLS
jgi:DNA processing protein